VDIRLTSLVTELHKPLLSNTYSIKNIVICDTFTLVIKALLGTQ